MTNSLFFNPHTIIMFSDITDRDVLFGPKWVKLAPNGRSKICIDYISAHQAPKFFPYGANPLYYMPKVLPIITELCLSNDWAVFTNPTDSSRSVFLHTEVMMEREAERERAAREWLAHRHVDLGSVGKTIDQTKQKLGWENINKFVFLTWKKKSYSIIRAVNHSALSRLLLNCLNVFVLFF